MRKPLFLIAAVCLTPAAPAGAQNTIPGLENFTLERPQPTPTVTPTPVPPAPSPIVTPTATPPTATSPPAAVPTPRVTAAPRTTATPVAQPSPTALPTATPGAGATPDVAPVPVVTPPPTAIEPTANAEPGRWPLWAALAGIVLAGIAGFVWWRRRRDHAESDHEVAAETVAAPPARTTDRPAPPPAKPAPAPTVPLPPPSVPAAASPKPGGLITSSLKPEVQLALQPLRGGVDTLRATLEYQLQVINTGRGAARGVAVEAWLLSAGHETAGDLQHLFASQAGELMLPPFDLPASGAIDLSGVAKAPRDVLATITAGERRMFVPILATRVRFADARGTETVLTAAFLIGLERDGQERLAPLPLDRGSRMHDRLAARPYGG